VQTDQREIASATAATQARIFQAANGLLDAQQRLADTQHAVANQGQLAIKAENDAVQQAAQLVAAADQRVATAEQLQEQQRQEAVRLIAEQTVAQERARQELQETSARLTALQQQAQTDAGNAREAARITEAKHQEVLRQVAADTERRLNNLNQQAEAKHAEIMQERHVAHEATKQAGIEMVRAELEERHRRDIQTLTEQLSNARNAREAARIADGQAILTARQEREKAVDLTEVSLPQMQRMASHLEAQEQAATEAAVERHRAEVAEANALLTSANAADQARGHKRLRNLQRKSDVLQTPGIQQMAIAADISSGITVDPTAQRSSTVTPGAMPGTIARMNVVNQFDGNGMHVSHSTQVAAIGTQNFIAFAGGNNGVHAQNERLVERTTRMTVDRVAAEIDASPEELATVIRSTRIPIMSSQHLKTTQTRTLHALHLGVIKQRYNALVDKINANADRAGQQQQLVHENWSIDDNDSTSYTKSLPNMIRDAQRQYVELGVKHGEFPRPDVVDNTPAPLVVPPVSSQLAEEAFESCKSQPAVFQRLRHLHGEMIEADFRRFIRAKNAADRNTVLQAVGRRAAAIASTSTSTRTKF
jgi:hypothetical protein